MPSRSCRLIIWDTDWHKSNVRQIGAKALQLGRVIRQGVPVPKAFCISSRAFQRFLAETDLAHELSSAESTSGQSLPSHILRTQFPTRLAAVIRNATNRLLASAPEGKPLLAIRSSFSLEDSPTALSAGIYESLVGVVGENVLQAVLRIWASAYSSAAISYRQSRGQSQIDIELAVIVQLAMVGELGGVLYGVHPVSGDVENFYVEAARGGPTSVTAGEALPLRASVNKRSLDISYSDGFPPSSKDSVLASLSRWATRAELALDSPLDIEWISSRQEVWLLQARQLPWTVPSEGGMIRSAYDVKLRSPKLLPFRGLPVNSRQFLADVVTPLVYARYREHKNKFDRHTHSMLLSLFKKYCNNGPVSIRSAYWSAYNSGDNLPQSSRLSSATSCVEFVRHYYEQIAASGLDDYSSEVAFLVTNWLPVKRSAIAFIETKDEHDVVMLHSVFGFPEGLETCAYDCHIVDLASGQTEFSDISEKCQAVLEPRSQPVSISDERVSASALDSVDISKIAAYMAHFSRNGGRVRAEFLITEKDDGGSATIIPWQVEFGRTVDASTYHLVPGTSGGRFGPYRAVLAKSVADLDYLKTAGSEPLLILLDLSSLDSRDRVLADKVVARTNGGDISVALRGSALSHLAASLRESGMKVFPINRAFDTALDGALVMLAPHDLVTNIFDVR